ncbi:MAG: polysaccharide deacetylase family protein [Candidatus Sumerlaeia bacterium]|nr:polysaccharide deacetylase family protein [Candidatus Sumerlaeia bacterium]
MGAILMYHYLGGAPAGHGHPALFVPPEVFRDQLAGLRGMGLRSVLGPEVDAGLGTPALERTVWLTFDDGMADNFEPGLRLLKDAGMTATFFIIAERSLGGAPGHMDLAQLRELLAEGMEVGAHTLTHPRLPTLGDAELRREVADSKARLEDALGAPVPSFAYPYGAYCDRSVRAVQEAGFRVAVSTIRGNRNGPGDRFLLRRVMVQPDRTGLRFRYSFTPFYRWAHDWKNRRRHGRA